MQWSQLALMDRLCAYIEGNLGKKLTLSILSAQAGISPYHLQRTFKQIVGVSPREYIEVLRSANMKRSLLKGETVTRAISKIMYEDHNK